MFVVQFIWNVNTGLQCHTYICVCVAIVATSSWWCLASQVPYSHTSTKNNCITNFYFNVIGQGFSIIFSSHTTNYYKRLIAYLAHCVTPGHGICIYMAIIMHTTLLWSEMWLGHVSVCLSDRTSDRVVEMSAHQKYTNKKQDNDHAKPSKLFGWRQAFAYFANDQVSPPKNDGIIFGFPDRILWSSINNIAS